MATTVNRRPGNAQTLLKVFPKIKKVLIAMSVVVGAALAIAILAAVFYSPKPQKGAGAGTHQIYANYTFPENAVQIDVRLLPENQLLSREAGGWVITPAGSNFRIDYDIPIAIEYIDGRKFYRQPGKPTNDGVRPDNGIFRLYKVGGGSGIAKVTIKRNVF